MNTTSQLNLNLTNREQLKTIWAFAIDKRNFANKRRRFTDFRDCVITSCSKEAKALGVRAGMHYNDAKRLIPQMRVLVIGGGRNV
jgi:uncharacterized protein YunC (DUF1805 family)